MFVSIDFEHCKRLRNLLYRPLHVYTARLFWPNPLSKVTYDVEFFLKVNGKIRFYDQGSGFDISDDATIQLENGKRFKIRDLKHANMISNGGKDITYEYLDNRDKKKHSKTNSFETKLSSIGKIFGK